jgi:hypothetical protein
MRRQLHPAATPPLPDAFFRKVAILPAQLQQNNSVTLVMAGLYGLSHCLT